MKYLVMIQGTQAEYEGMRGKVSPGAPAWSEEDVQAMYAFMGALNEDLSKAGELVDGQGLAEPARARSVLLGEDGKPVVTDGAPDATAVTLAGYWVLDCDSLDRVTEIAERILQCPGPEGMAVHPVVIRPILDGAADM
ncbi:YciI family protein [Streptomyces phyllanthi]|uniref:YCII-related domain-containing protein n=1 Tax=Streptomyces phyllanthi TaxID=1803180 RepID=A0A5N8WAL3_9ACTN|nr:YciI family protein [Streptomyces phyllanthi]MPY43175.1 hypothetical protein [Streptomyces phyllanthi]